MNALPKVSPCYEVEFQSSLLIEIDELGVDRESEPVRMKALVAKGRGPVTVMSLWAYDVHDLTYGGLAYWKAFHFPRHFIRQVERLLDKAYAEQET